MKNITLLFLAIFSFPLLLKAQPTFIGACSQGGNQFGTILSYTVGDTTFDKVYKFKGVEGDNPQQTNFISAGGKLYGMTSEGGAYNHGIIFEYNPITNVHIKKYDFNDLDGASPTGSLMLASNGKMYGMTKNGGATNSLGVIFEYDYISNEYVKKFDFTSASGCYPDGCSLIEAPNGKLYGMTTEGGTNLDGVIFEYDYISNIYTKKVDLDILIGSEPQGSLILASNGKLYGMTVSGGLNYVGVIFEYDYMTNVYTKKYDFITSEGKNPKGSLIEASIGKFYGVTYSGGTGSGGVLFEYNYNNNTYTKKAEISSITGYFPSGSLFEATHANLYGCTTEGGTTTNGLLFEYQINNDSLILKANLVSIGSKAPKGSLFQASNGKMYGTSSEGGVMNSGTIFEYDIYNNSLLKKKEFSKAECSDMQGSLLKASNGKFYGMTNTGGSEGKGALIEYDYGTNETFIKINLTQFSGVNPKGSLIEASNGKIYGMTYGGGINYGVIFEYDFINNVYANKFNFSSAIGRCPFGDLVEAPNNKLYGMTYSGGGSGVSGTIFEYDYNTNIYILKHAFADDTIGAFPYGSLMIATNGKMYGMTSEGGVSEGGVIFEYDYVNNLLTQKVSLFGQWGISQPHGTLIEGSNNKLYGLTTTSIIEYDFINDTFMEKYLFTNANGSVPFGSLMLASNNKMYGMTRIGGIYNYGVIFEYDYLADTYTKVIDLEAKNSGSYPMYTTLVEVNCIAPYIVPSGPTSFCRGGNVTLNSGSVGNSYQWNRNGNLIPGANSSSLLVTNPGRYSVTVTDSNCVSTLTSNVVRVKVPCLPPFDPQEKIAAGDNTVESTDFYSYYESMNKTLNMWGENLKGTTYYISIFNSTGKFLVTEKGNISNGDLDHQIDCTAFASGLYIVKLSTNLEQFTNKFVKGN